MKKLFLVSLGSLACGISLGIFGTLLYFKEIDEAKASAAWVVGMDSLKKKDYRQAIAAFNRSLAFFPDQYQPHISLAHAYEMLRLLDMALEEYSLAAGLNGARDKSERVDKTMILSKMGDIYLGQGQYQEAVKAYREGTELNAQWPDLYRGLGLAYHKMGNIEEAKENLRRYLQYEDREKKAEEKKAAEELLKKLEKGKAPSP